MKPIKLWLWVSCHGRVHFCCDGRVHFCCDGRVHFSCHGRVHFFVPWSGSLFCAMVGFTSLGSTIAPLNSTLFSLALTCGWEISVLWEIHCFMRNPLFCEEFINPRLFFKCQWFFPSADGFFQVSMIFLKTKFRFFLSWKNKKFTAKREKKREEKLTKVFSHETKSILSINHLKSKIWTPSLATRSKPADLRLRNR